MPRHAEDYDGNAARYVEALKKLQADGKTKLAEKKNRKIIGFHDSLEYFAKSFGLAIVDVIEQTAGESRPAKQMAKLVKKCKKESVRRHRRRAAVSGEQLGGDSPARSWASRTTT